MSTIAAAAQAAPPIAQSIAALSRFACNEGHYNTLAVILARAPGQPDGGAPDRSRWRTFLNIAPRRAIAELLFQMNLSADDVAIAATVRTPGASDIDCAIVTADPGPPRPLVLIWSLPHDEAKKALAELGRGVRP